MVRDFVMHNSRGVRKFATPECLLVKPVPSAPTTAATCGSGRARAAPGIWSPTDADSLASWGPAPKHRLSRFEPVKEIVHDSWVSVHYFNAKPGLLAASGEQLVIG
jgi:hypothetical protein